MTQGGAFEEQFPELFTQAYHVAYRIVVNRNDAEDVAAEATARALDRWRRVHTLPSPTAWCVRVATNLAIDVVRKRRHAVGAIVPHWTETDRAETRIDVQELIRRLPRRQREVVVLRYVAEYSEAEIAFALGISQGSVKQHASRALERLRRHDLEGAPNYAW